MNKKYVRKNLDWRTEKLKKKKVENIETSQKIYSTVRRSKIQIILDLEKENREHGRVNIWKTMLKNFPKLMKDKTPQFKSAANTQAGQIQSNIQVKPLKKRRQTILKSSHMYM